MLTLEWVKIKVGGRVCKNLKISETRPDLNFRVSLGHGTRNLKTLISETRPDPDLTIRVRVFSRVSRVSWTLKFSIRVICSITGIVL